MNMSLVSMYASRVGNVGKTMAGKDPISQQMVARPVSFNAPVGFASYQQAIAEVRGLMHQDCYVLTGFGTIALISFGCILGVDQPGWITQHLWVAPASLISLPFIGRIAQVPIGQIILPILTPEQIAAANIGMVEIVTFWYSHGGSYFSGVNVMTPAIYASRGPQVLSSEMAQMMSPAP
jgi:hypothetical protein